VNADTLWLFVLTIAAVSLTPGMCMSLAFSLGLYIGYRRTLFMMAGELVGVASVVTVSVLILRGVLSVDPAVFKILSIIGALYLLWLAGQLWQGSGGFSQRDVSGSVGALVLVRLGFVTAVMNPKGWAFMLALLPGFMTAEQLLFEQLTLFLSVMLTTEFVSLSLYAGGGRWLRHRLNDSGWLSHLNKLVAVLMVLVAALVFV